jgi:hypothetical protein
VIGGIGIKEQSYQLRIHPNPTARSVSIYCPQEPRELVIYDLSGRTYALSYQREGMYLRADLTEFTAGSYMIGILSNRQVHYSKILIKDQ